VALSLNGGSMNLAPVSSEFQTPEASQPDRSGVGRSRQAPLACRLPHRPTRDLNPTPWRR